MNNDDNVNNSLFLGFSFLFVDLLITAVDIFIPLIVSIINILAITTAIIIVIPIICGFLHHFLRPVCPIWDRGVSKFDKSSKGVQYLGRIAFLLLPVDVSFSPFAFVNVDKGLSDVLVGLKHI